MRKFDSGATRDDEAMKIDYEGFLSALTLKRYGQYMHSHRIQSDGELRASDNWKKGIPLDAYMKSMWRHFMAVWIDHSIKKDPTEDLCALLFNVMGMLHELEKEKLSHA